MKPSHKRSRQDELFTVNALHPGVINTNLLRAGWSSMGAPVENGASRILYLATSGDVKGISASYFMNNRPIASASISYDKTVQGHLWELSKQYLNMFKP